MEPISSGVMGLSVETSAVVSKMTEICQKINGVENSVFFASLGSSARDCYREILTELNCDQVTFQKLLLEKESLFQRLSTSLNVLLIASRANPGALCYYADGQGQHTNPELLRQSYNHDMCFGLDPRVREKITAHGFNVRGISWSDSEKTITISHSGHKATISLADASGWPKYFDAKNNILLRNFLRDCTEAFQGSMRSRGGDSLSSVDELVQSLYVV